jgi:t-SNARE complex subunit (syntaxin)
MSKEWTEAEIQREAQREVKKIRRTASGRELDDFITKMIKTSTKAPANLNRARIATQKATKGIREKAKKKKLGANLWVIALIILIPVLIVVFLVLNKKVEIPVEEEPEDQGFP